MPFQFQFVDEWNTHSFSWCQFSVVHKVSNLLFVIQVDLNNRGMFLSFKMANDLLLAASGEKVS